MMHIINATKDLTVTVPIQYSLLVLQQKNIPLINLFTNMESMQPLSRSLLWKYVII